ncbi:LOW QUALITY PROTEIN: hydrogen peroxide-inducible genes activator [Vibrio sp. JCM 18905]|nr:LOW QUALITY PROTEIN: hydrogen peroxide-inducible genes activator [Vibrio sp. JCM 18905]
MNKWPSLKQLHYLVTLHETRHFSDAAERCFVSQSTLSKGIQNLEELIGCPLYEKKDKKSPLVFTQTGEMVVKQGGRELLAKGQDLVELGRMCQGDDMQGQLKVGCIPTIAPFLLCDLVQEVNYRFPQLNLLLREDTTTNLLQALRHGELDVLILALPVEIDGMESRVVGKDPFRMVISANQAQSVPVPIRYADLPDESVFLLEKEHCLTEHAYQRVNQIKKKLIPFTATSLHTLVQMVANGLGTTFIPQMAIDHGLLHNQNLVVIDPPPGKQAYREIGLVWRPSSSRTKTFNQLAEVVSELL